jgi:hypothetical protein
VPTLVFPVLGDATYTDDFGEPRGQGRHEGNDMMAPKRALRPRRGSGHRQVLDDLVACRLHALPRGRERHEYLYVHLNNDLTLENDNQGTCVPGVAYAKGLKSGAKVLAGEPIGFVGDSGDRERDPRAPPLRGASEREALRSVRTRTCARRSGCSSRPGPERRSRLR